MMHVMAYIHHEVKVSGGGGSGVIGEKEDTYDTKIFEKRLCTITWGDDGVMSCTVCDCAIKCFFFKLALILYFCWCGCAHVYALCL